MAIDIGHQWGADLDLSQTGDLATVDGSTAVLQRILRRLLTNSGGYIWNLTYGAGLSGFVGQPLSPPKIAAIVRTQMLQETAVMTSPPPGISVFQPDGVGSGTFEVAIQYQDAASHQTNNISLPITG